jgi:hypothetical protein
VSDGKDLSASIAKRQVSDLVLAAAVTISTNPTVPFTLASCQADQKLLGARRHRRDPINVTGSKARRIFGVVTMDCQVR